MIDLKLSRVATGAVAAELSATASKLERDFQKIVEANMNGFPFSVRDLETFFGVRLLASEFSAGPVHGGRMDSIGIDEDETLVIFEYKRNLSESVINQGLFYLDWLLDHQGDFKVLVMEKVGAEAAAHIDFSSPHLICVANAFNRYDGHAIRQMGRSIELVRYQHFDGDLLALELFSSTTAGPTPARVPTTAAVVQPKPNESTGKYSTFSENLERSPQELKALYEELRLAIEAIGDDITMKLTRYYVNFRRLKSFASLEVYPQARKLHAYVKVDPASIELEEGFSRDVTHIGHLGNGNLELTGTSAESLAKALPLIQSSYEAN